MKHRKRETVFVLIIVFLTWTYTNRFGYLDTFPRIRQSTPSPDGDRKFEVYQRKLEWLNPFADSEIVFRIRDLRADIVYEERIWRSAWTNGFEKGKKYNVRFEKDVIIVNEFWVARKDYLKFEMCPLLECLTESD